MSTKGLALTAVLLSCCLPQVVSAAPMTFSYTVPLSTTGWSTDITLPKFNPAWGTLDSVTLTLDGHLEGSAGFESEYADSSTVTMNLSADIQLKRPNNTVLMVASPLLSQIENVLAFDNTIDYDGASGRHYSGLTANDSDSVTLLPADSDFSLFIGTDNLVLPARSTSTSQATGPGHIDEWFDTESRAVATVTYNFTPEPATLALMGLAGLLIRRRRTA